MSRTRIVRQKIWSRLAEVARADSRFHFDFSEFIPDFEGSDAATDRLFALDAVASARLVFATPDNSLIEARRRLIAAGVTLIVPTYNIHRGFRLIEGGSVPAADVAFAAHLDGLEAFGRPIGLEEIAARGRFDAFLTGASAISAEGIRFGRGHVYFAIEWGLFSEIGVVDDTTPVVALVHDVQLVEERLYPSPEDVLVDTIVTPTRRVDIPNRPPRPRGLRFDTLDPDRIEAIPPLKELQRFRGLVR
jgi:5-formyltetrahydrofolate cyclo-ligase